MANFDHPPKKIIREKWCKQLLKNIKENIGSKLIYLGLPGIEALDIKTWIDYIDKVIAFQCRDYPNPSHPAQPKTQVTQLDSKLREIERKGLIKSYSLYDGWIEEVVLRGRDTEGNSFSQEDVVTVYNLDFCNSLTVPLPIPDDTGEIKNYYKLDAISKLLEFQRDLAFKSNKRKFIMFLTIHSQFWKDEAEKLLNGSDSELIEKYMDKIDKSKLKDNDKNIRLLKLYVYHILKNHFCSRNFIPEFLPPIYYKGIGTGQENWLILFTILGTHFPGPSSSAPCYQDPKSFLKNRFLFADKDKIDSLLDKKIKEDQIETNPEKLFQNSKTYEIWSKI